MKDFWIGVLIGVLVTVATVAPRLWGSPTYGKILRDYSITNTYIINEDTVIVCKVLKVRQTETVLPNDNTKPEVTL